MTSAYLHAIESTTGLRRSFLADIADDASLVERTRAEGIDGYFDADVDAWELAIPAVQRTLDRAGVTVADIDLIVYCTESTDSRPAISRDPDKLAAAIGAPYTPLIGVTANVCANAGAALRFARDAIVAGDATTILVVTTDAWDERPRLVDAGTCLMSDAAASAIVSTTPPDSDVAWRVDAVHAAVDHSMHDVDPAVATVAMIRGTVAGLQRAVRLRAERLPTSGGTTTADHVVSGNLGDTVIKMFARVLGVDDVSIDRLTTENGHCLAADSLINLDHFAAKMGHDDTVLVLSTGHNYWTCVDLTTVRTAS